MVVNNTTSWCHGTCVAFRYVLIIVKPARLPYASVNACVHVTQPRPVPLCLAGNSQCYSSTCSGFWFTAAALSAEPSRRQTRPHTMVSYADCPTTAAAEQLFPCS